MRTMTVLGFILWVAILAVMLSSCASFDRTYTNSAGGEFRCQSSGYGISGTLSADAARQSCEARALAAGYK